METDHPRDFVGYGAAPPDPKWPGGASLAVQFVINYEEGSEYSMPDGDGFSEGPQLGLQLGVCLPERDAGNFVGPLLNRCAGLGVGSGRVAIDITGVQPKTKPLQSQNRGGFTA